MGRYSILKTETAMWKSLKAMTQDEVMWTRLEARIGAGMPDVNGALYSGEFWIEFKVCDTVAFKTIGLWRPLQVSWQTVRAAKFPNVWNVVGHTRGEKIYVYRCDKVFDLNSSSETPPADFVMSYPVNWRDLIGLISNSLKSRPHSNGLECAPLG